MTADIPDNSGPFYHGTKADFKPGDLISPGYRSNYSHGERTLPWVYMTATRSAIGAELAKGEGPGRLYIVEPTGPYTDDPDLTDKKFPGNPTRSYRSRFPLRVVGEVTDWEPHPPEQIAAMREGQRRLYALQADRIARIPGEAELERVHAEGDALASAWAGDAEYRGCMLLMRIRGSAVALCAGLSYHSPARGETRIIERPSQEEVLEWPQREQPMSGRVARVSAWREGWVAVIESCVTEIGLSTETRIWVVADVARDALDFQVDAEGSDRSWRRDFRLVRGVLTDAEHGEIWDFMRESP
jgi:rifampin ADP-ribosylating transferase